MNLNLLYFLVTYVGVLVGHIGITAAIPHARLRVSALSFQNPLDVFSFPDTPRKPSSRPEDYTSEVKRYPGISNYIANSNPYLRGGPIVFDEDYDEPLRPQEVFPDRSAIPSAKQSNRMTTTPQSIKRITYTEKMNTHRTTKRPAKVTTEFQPIVFVSSSTTTESSSSTKKPRTSTAASSADCIVSEDDDCDEIIIEGSVYAPLIYRNNERRAQLRGNKAHPIEGFFLA